MNIEGGIKKILSKGAHDPEAVRFHVPQEGGGWGQVTWGEVLRRATQIAMWLDREGIRKDKKVSVYATTRIEWAYVVPAIEACRGVFVPVYFSNTAAQVQYVVDHCDAEILFTEKALLGRLVEHWDDYPKLKKVVVWDLGDEAPNVPSRRDEIVSLDRVYAEGERLAAQTPARLEQMLSAMDDSDVAAIIYTSGTTGLPKGAMLSVHNLKASAGSWHEVLEHAFPPEGQRRDILWLPVSHMSGWGILGQGTMYEYETWLSDPFHLLQILPEVKPTMLLSVPAYWEKMYAVAKSASKDEHEQYATLRALTGGALTFLLSGGAGLQREVKEFFRRAGIQMIEGYGMTECSPNLTMNRLDDFDFDSVGKPMPGVELEIAEDGEIVVKGENVFLGYYKNLEATRACYGAEGWFHTGDLGAWTDRGFVAFKGRKKEIIATSGGKKIGPAGIEVLFAPNPMIEHVVVYGDERKYLTALVTLSGPVLAAWAAENGKQGHTHGDLVASDEVRGLVQAAVDQVNAQLASYETIKKHYLHPGHLSVDAGQLTPSLKLRRKNVWEDFGPQFDAMYEG